MLANISLAFKCRARTSMRHYLFSCQGIWGTVCDDYFGKNEAKVVCRMLGFSPEDVARASIYDGEKDFTATSGPIWVRFTNGTIPSNAVAQRCSGTEGSLNECNVSMISNWFSKLK